MEYMDEQLLKVKKQFATQEEDRFSEETIQKELEHSILDGLIEVNGIPVQFSEHTVCGGRMTVWMPTDFVSMSEEEIVQQYPLGSRPQEVYHNAYLPLAVLFNLTSNEIPDAHIQEMSQLAKRMISMSGPKTRFFLEETFAIGTHHLAIQNFTSATLSSILFNKMFFVSVDNQVLMGNINFDNKLVKRYEKIASEIVHSLQFVGDREVN